MAIPTFNGLTEQQYRRELTAKGMPADLLERCVAAELMEPPYTREMHEAKLAAYADARAFFRGTH